MRISCGLAGTTPDFFHDKYAWIMFENCENFFFQASEWGMLYGITARLVSFVAILCFCVCLDASICRYTHYQSMLFLAAQLLSRCIVHGIPVVTSSRVQISLLLALMFHVFTILSLGELNTLPSLRLLCQTPPRCTTNMSAGNETLPSQEQA